MFGGQMDFAITRPGSVNEIIISDGESRAFLQKDGNGEWVLNSEHEPRKKAVDLMLQTLTRLRSNYPVALTEREDLTGNFNDRATRVEVKTGNRTRSWLIYSEGQESPTFMLKEGDSKAYVVEVLGFSGHVASLFVADESFWRSNNLFNYHMSEIAEVTVQHKDPDMQSFRLSQSPEREFTLYEFPGGEQIPEISDSLAVRFLANFFYVPFERYANKNEEVLIDSLVRSDPDHIIGLKDFSGNTHEIYLHRKALNNTTETEEYDPFRLYALKEEKRELVIIPYLSVDLLLRSASYFTSHNR